MFGTGEPIKYKNQPSQINAHANLTTHALYSQQHADSFCAIATLPPPASADPLSKSERRTDRTTKMLVAVLLLFFITEFPQGVLGLLSGILGRCFFQNCYHRFGEIMDMLALLNGAINFILYCSMSRQFRTTFGHLFKPRSMLAKWATPSQTEVQSTFV
uniref:G-protein coupled receptors family 1 profile domain-containing protein n=1 Tax=Timema shepardi TaxID=629360 RepID=A0A7R9AUP7_TIMSH|nr:unnamed protein product [Timema shepardi]